MKNPTQEQFQIVIDTLIKANEMAGNRAGVQMMHGSIHKPECGSPMCHGGWYFVAKGLKKGNFMQGAKRMAKDLGFKNDETLEDWALRNPEIWGNKFGDSMFCSNRAFGDVYIDSLQQIINHWKCVKERAASC